MARKLALVWRAILPAGGLSIRRFPIRDEFRRLLCGMTAKHEAGEVPANCVNGLFYGGLKGRLQARLPATRRKT
jgi:hypothetical protein